MATDLEIAREAKLEPIENIARTAGFLPETVSPYGRYVAKIDQRAYADLPQRAKLVLVTAIGKALLKVMQPVQRTGAV